MQSLLYQIIPILRKITSKPHILTLVLIIIISLLTSITRITDIDNTDHMVFDENFFIPLARKYINGEYFGDPHPPLGKLIITAGAVIFPSTNEEVRFQEKESLLKYRIAPALFGCMIPIVGFLILKILTKSNLFSFIGSIFLVFDNFLIIYSRYALHDSILLFFIITSFLFSILYLSKRRKNSTSVGFVLLLLSGLFSGAAFSTKLSGLSSLTFIYFALLWEFVKTWDGIRIKHFINLFVKISIPTIITVLVFLLAHWIHFSLLKYNGDSLHEMSGEYQICIVQKDKCEKDIFQMTTELSAWYMNYHNAIGPFDLCAEDEMGSPPHYWPLMGRAIPFSFSNHATIPLTDVSYIYLIGNPLVWLFGLSGVITTVCLSITSLLYLKSILNKKSILLFACYIVNFLPYFLIDRILYIYLYLPAFVFSIFIFTLLLQKLYLLHLKNKFNQAGRVIIGLLTFLLVILAFVLYSPLTYNIKISRGYIEKLIILDIWNLKVDPFHYEGFD